MPGYVPVTLLDDSIWEKDITAYEVNEYILHLLSHDRGGNVEHLFPTLGIDKKTRLDQDNVLNIARREIKEYRTVNKSLAMELFCSLMLTYIDSPNWVRCCCQIRRAGIPHRFAPPGHSDIISCYPTSGQKNEFGVIAEVSAKRMITQEFYKKQLMQALKHASQIDATKAGCCPDMPTYSILINGGEIGSNEKLQNVYRSFVQHNNLQPDGPVRIIPMDAVDIAVALQRIEDRGGRNPLFFGSDKLVMIFDTLQEGLLQDEAHDDPDWMCHVWTDVLTTRPTQDIFKPDN